MSLPKPIIAYVPPEFRPKEHSPYPSDNLAPFEEYFYNNFDANADRTERLYLPIFWTAYHRNNNYGRMPQAIAHLQNFVDAIDRSRKYYTIVQYDDGCLIDFKDLDIKVFSMAGKPMDYTLPLISTEHAFQFPNEKRDIFCSFVGRITHPLRQQMIQCAGKIRNDGKDWYVNLYSHPMPEYCRILAKSVFSLCPRGYSFNSFRIQESLQYGAIPVIISDEWHSPFDLQMSSFCVFISPENIYRIDTILNSISQEDITELQQVGARVYQSYFTFPSAKKIIINILSNELA